MDRASLADIDGLQQIVQRIAPQQLNLQMHSIGWKSLEFDRVYRTKELKRLFRNFGPNLETISLVFVRENIKPRNCHHVIPWLKRYCGENLKSVSIQDLDINKEVLPNLKPFFKQLQKLELLYVSVIDEPTIFEGFDSLTELTVICVDNDRAFMENTFPRLERFKYRTWFGLEEVMKRFRNFLSRHKSLITLDIHLHCDSDKTTKIFQSIGDNCMQLKELTANIMSEVSLVPLNTLKSLTKLGLRSAWCKDEDFFPELPELRECIVDYHFLPQTVERLASLSNLTKLRVFKGDHSSPFDVVGIVSTLSSLEDFSIVSNWSEFVLDKVTYLQIIDITNVRPSSLRMKCNHESDVKLNEPL